MKLVICEKPSVAKAVASALGVTSRADGCFEGNGLIVSWCVGHLVELAPADAYDEKYAKWRREDLPILPQHWQYVVPQGKEKQGMSIDVITIDDKPASAQAANLFKWGGRTAKTRGALTAPLEIITRRTDRAKSSSRYGQDR